MSHSHDHSVKNNPSGKSFRVLSLVLALTVVFMLVEVVGGWLSGSLALIADAGHMLTDAMALGLALVAVWLSRAEVTLERTYGFRRAEVLAAFVNALTLVLLSLWIVGEAIGRLNAPPEVRADVVLWVGLAGLGVNLVAWRLLHRAAHDSLNIRAAMWHVVGDLLGSVGVVVSALVIRFTGWNLIDPLISFFIAALIGLGGGRILLESAHLLLDAVPRNISQAQVRAFLLSVKDVETICDLHIWGINAKDVILTAHLIVKEEADRDDLLHQLLSELEARFSFGHMTIQLEGTQMDSCQETW